MTIKLLAGDCLGLLRELADNSVDACVTDPPYSSGGMYRGDRQADPLEKYLVEGGAQGYSSFSGDSRDQRGFGYWCSLWLSECLRCCKPGGWLLVFTDWRQLPTMTDAIQAGGWVWRGIVAWDKTEAARPEKGRFRHQCEYILWATKGPVLSSGDAPCLPGCFRYSIPRRDKMHPTGKPVALIRDVLRVVPGGTVLDPFMGSGTTGMACAELGLSFIGMEIERPHFEIARQRLAPWIDEAPIAPPMMAAPVAIPRSLFSSALGDDL